MINESENRFEFQHNKNIKNICLTILETIIHYTSKLKKIPSAFDNNSNKENKKDIDKYDYSNFV